MMRATRTARSTCGGLVFVLALVAAGWAAEGVAPSVVRDAALVGDRVVVRGLVTEVLGRHFFRIADAPRDDGVLVMMTTPWSSPVRGETVVVRGAVRRFRPHALQRRYGWRGWVASAAARAEQGAIVVAARSVRGRRGVDYVHEAPPPVPGGYRGVPR